MEGPKFVHDHLTRGGQIDFITVSEDASDESLMVAKIADSSGFVVIRVPAHIYTCISKTETPQGSPQSVQLLNTLSVTYSQEELFLFLTEWLTLEMPALPFVPLQPSDVPELFF